MPERTAIDPELRRFLDDQMVAAPGPVRSPFDARSRMERALASRSTLPGLPNGVTTADHYLEREGTGLRLRVYTPPPPVREPSPVLVYLHGGGWVAGSIETHDPFCRLLALLAGITIVSADYRLAPEYPYPAALEDTVRALEWTVAHAESWGASPELLALGGDSAGANLAAVTANRLAMDRKPPKLLALLLLYPVTDHPNAGHASYAQNATGYGLEAASMRWYWEQYAAGISPEDPAISPLRAPVQLPLPPALVATAEYDVLRDEGLAYVRKLQTAGTVVTHLHAPDMHHDFPVSPATVARFSQSHAALAEVAAWLRGRFNGKLK